MYKLVADYGRWAVKDRSIDRYIYIFSNVVWVGSASEARKYTLIREDSYEEIPLEKPIEEYLVECNITKEYIGTKKNQ